MSGGTRKSVLVDSDFILLVRLFLVDQFLSSNKSWDKRNRHVPLCSGRKKWEESSRPTLDVETRKKKKSRNICFDDWGGGGGIRRFRPRGGHQNNPFRG